MWSWIPFNNTIILTIHSIPQIKWKGTDCYVPKGIISFIWERGLVVKGCLYYLAYISDTSTDTPLLELVTMACELDDVFPTDLLGLLLDRDIDFGISVEMGTQPISILPYQMSLFELWELKE